MYKQASHFIYLVGIDKMRGDKEKYLRSVCINKINWACGVQYKKNKIIYISRVYIYIYIRGHDNNHDTKIKMI